VRILLERVGSEVIGGAHIEVLRPLRSPKTKLAKKAELERVVALAQLKLAAHSSLDRPLILILVDADEDPPCQLGPGLLAIAREARSDLDVVCVIANVEYETWFVAAARSLAKRGRLQLAAGEQPPDDPEEARCGAAWIQKHFTGIRYSKTIDQPALTREMDLGECRRHSRSFDKLCRDMEAASKRAETIPVRGDEPT
jgi:Domain of unknown function (DUF4276)